MGEGIPHGTSVTVMHREAGRFQEAHRPPGHISLAICDLSPPWPPVIPTCLPPSQMFEAGGGGLRRLAGSHGELQRLVEEVTSSPPARESPGDGAGRALHKQETPVGGGWRGVLTAAGQLGQQEMAMATSPGHWEPPPCPPRECCGPQPSIMGLGRQ